MRSSSDVHNAYVRSFQALSWSVAAAYLGQAVLAGQFFSGTYAALGLHATRGTVSDVILFLGLVIAALLRWHAKGPIWPFWAALSLLVANQVQNGAGAARLISLHIPLGVTMLAVAVAIALAVPRARRSAGPPVHTDAGAAPGSWNRQQELV